jgi:flagellar basal-body rod modification protein FlgD
MSTTTSVSALTTSASSSTYSNPSSNLDESDFLQLMLKQLQCQDPLNPTDTSTMTSQITQYSMLDQIQQMNSSMSSVRAYSMLGTTASYTSTDSDTGSTTSGSGSVTGVKVSSGTTYLEIGGNYVDIDDVTEVTKAS